MNKYFRIKPAVTEKSLRLAGENQYTFFVERGVNKLTIAEAIAKHYGVTVLDVKTLKLPGKPKGRLKSTSGNTKVKIKAVVRIKKGETIPGYTLTEEDTKESKKEKKAKNGN